MSFQVYDLSGLFRAPLTRKDEFLNQPIAQIVDDNMYGI